MDFTIPEQALMLQALARKFVKEEWFPLEEEMSRQDPDWIELPDETFNKIRARLKELGLWALDVPPEYGGAGLDTLTYSLIAQEQYKSVVGTINLSPMWAHNTIMLFPVLYRSSPYIKEKYLYPLIRGEKRAATAHTEPDAGSDAAAITTQAVREGNSWVINGVKRFTTLADRSDFLYLNAVTDKSRGKDGISMFLIDMNNPGIKIDKIWDVISQPTTELVITDCRVSDEQRLEGSGLHIFEDAIGKARVLMVQGCIGRALRGLDLTTQYVQNRKTFGQLLSTRQAVQFMLADTAVDIHLTKLLAFETAWKVDQGMDVRDEANMIKVLGTEMAYRAMDRYIQCFGGIGLTKTLPLERWLRELRVLRITDGASEVLRWVLARSLLKGWRP
jgi:acyl-CoA dehydrogenase